MKLKFGLITGLVFAVFGMPVTAHAAGGMTATIASKEPAKSVLTLKNNGTTACQAANTATGTVAITNVVQSGKPVAPSPVEVSLEEGLDLTLPTLLKTLQPGESLAIPLRTAVSGGAVYIQSVTWSPIGGTLGLVYKVDPNRPVHIGLNYSVPLDSETDVPICGLVAASNIPTGRGLSGVLKMVAVIALVIILAAAITLLAWWLRRKRTKGDTKAVTAAVVLIFAGAGMVALLPSQPAAAQVNVPDSVRGDWDACLNTLRENADLTGPILALIDDPAVNIIIDPRSTGGAEMLAYPDGSYHIEWNVNDRHPYAGTGGNADPCTSMYHELYHIMDMRNGTFSRDDCAGSGIEIKEVMATRAQNALRARLGMPERSHYGRLPLPAGDCRAAPAGTTCRSGRCGRTTGEPHLLTFDNLRYDFQAAGEFVLARSTDKTFEVQTRQQRWQDSRTVSVNTAAAVKTPRHRVEVAAKGYKLAMKIDGAAQPLQNTTLDDGTVLTADANTNQVGIALPEGSTVSVLGLGNNALDVVVDPAEALKGKLEGLLGDYNAESKGDLKFQGGKQTVEPTFEQLYPKFADSWRITDASSLFSYPRGTNTRDFTDRAFPYEKVDRSRIAGYAAAEALCKRLGITGKADLADCALDVAVTGRPEFARSAVRASRLVSGHTTGAETYLLAANKPGDIAKVSFTGKKDEKVFIEILESTFPSTCGVFTLRDHADTRLADACIINGTGYLETAVLPADGTYSLQLKANESAAGEARVRLFRVTDQTGSVSIDGKAVTAAIPTPGMEARFTFTAAAGQRIFINTSNVLLTSQCSPLGVLDPGGERIADGCIINNKGYIDTLALKQSGQYTLRVNPSESSTGTLTLKISSAQLIAKTIAVGGSAKINFARPGDEAEVRFRGNAGQKVNVAVSGNTLPSQCGGFSLRFPNGSKEDGCIIGTSDVLKEGGITLPVTGEYVIHFNPTEANTGELTVSVQ